MSLKIIDKMHETLEFNKVLQLLEEQALSENARHRIRQLTPYLSEADINRHMNETTQARLILEQYGNPPLSPMNDLEKALSSLAKLLVNHKRLKLHVASEELYPDDYDFSVVFDSVADRKKRKQMTKKHNPDLQIEITEGERK